MRPGGEDYESESGSGPDPVSGDVVALDAEGATSSSSPDGGGSLGARLGAAAAAAAVSETSGGPEPGDEGMGSEDDDGRGSGSSWEIDHAHVVCAGGDAGRQSIDFHEEEGAARSGPRQVCGGEEANGSSSFNTSLSKAVGVDALAGIRGPEDEIAGDGCAIYAAASIEVGATGVDDRPGGVAGGNEEEPTLSRPSPPPPPSPRSARFCRYGRRTFLVGELGGAAGEDLGTLSSGESADARVEVKKAVGEAASENPKFGGDDGALDVGLAERDDGLDDGPNDTTDGGPLAGGGVRRARIYGRHASSAGSWSQGASLSPRARSRGDPTAASVADLVGTPPPPSPTRVELLSVLATRMRNAGDVDASDGVERAETLDPALSANAPPSPVDAAFARGDKGVGGAGRHAAEFGGAATNFINKVVAAPPALVVKKGREENGMTLSQGGSRPGLEQEVQMEMESTGVNRKEMTRSANSPTGRRKETGEVAEAGAADSSDVDTDRTGRNAASKVQEGEDEDRVVADGTEKTTTPDAMNGQKADVCDTSSLGIDLMPKEGDEISGGTVGAVGIASAADLTSGPGGADMTGSEAAKFADACAPSKSSAALTPPRSVLHSAGTPRRTALRSCGATPNKRTHLTCSNSRGSPIRSDASFASPPSAESVGDLGAANQLLSTRRNRTLFEGNGTAVSGDRGKGRPVDRGRDGSSSAAGTVSSSPGAADAGALPPSSSDSSLPKSAEVAMVGGRNIAAKLVHVGGIEGTGLDESDNAWDSGNGCPANGGLVRSCYVGVTASSLPGAVGESVPPPTTNLPLSDSVDAGGDLPNSSREKDGVAVTKGAGSDNAGSDTDLFAICRKSLPSTVEVVGHREIVENGAASIASGEGGVTGDTGDGNTVAR